MRDDLVIRPLRPALRRTVSVALPGPGHRPPAVEATLEVLATTSETLLNDLFS